MNIFRNLRNSIATKLAVYGLIIAVVLGVLASIPQIIQDYKEENARIDKIMAEILGASSAAAVEAAYLLDERLAQDSVAAVLTYDFIARVQIVDDRGVIRSDVTQTQTHSFIHKLNRFMGEDFREYEHQLIEQNSQLVVGTLKATAHIGKFMEEFYIRSLRVLIGGVVRNAVMTILLLFVFHNTLSKPLQELVKRVRGVNPKYPDTFEVPKSIVESNNEINEVADSVNEILASSKHNLQELAESRKTTARVSAELRHTERLSVVGQLTGGVAHDFNNILAIILGTLELMQKEKLTQRGKKNLNVAVTAANRGATLTDQLLAFSRKQPLSPRTLSVSSLFDGIQKLLQGTLGEQVELIFESDENTWLFEADPQQLESVILNLVINARDATPNGGKITIKAFNNPIDEKMASENLDLQVGDYVCFEISDKGVGMAPEILKQAIEPFFTTKDVGEGAGLGLSMAYGFAKQSGGHLFLSSTAGEGTNVSLYLPRSQASELQDALSPDIDLTDENNTPDLTGYSILVTEDDSALSTTIRNHLQLMGAKTIGAQDGKSALKISRKTEKIDLFLIDIVLPGKINGLELSKTLEQERGPIKAIFMSGYSQNTVVQDGRLSPGLVLLQKPFTSQKLGRTIKNFLKKEEDDT